MATSYAVRAEVLAEAWNRIDPTGAPMLAKWGKEVANRRPYEGIKVFHNIPLSIETVCKLHVLVLAGAEVVVSCTKFLVPATFPEALQLVEQAGLEFRKEKQVEAGEFDFYLDCCGELAHKPAPKEGVVELTRTGALIYEQQDVAVPVLSIDDSRLKALETFYGTGDGFIRAFAELCGREVASQRFLVIGYGKVGQGVAHALAEAGAQVAMVDGDPEKQRLGRAKELDVASPSSPEADALADWADVIVTATGRAQVLGTIFTEAEQRLAGKVIANIGADDEIGTGFEQSEILGNRMPINFCLKHPTTMRYLDPSFHAHNLGIQVIREKGWTRGYHPFPELLDQKIVVHWMQLHHDVA